MNVKKELTTLVTLFTLFLNTPLLAQEQGKINWCNFMYTTYNRIQHHKEELKDLYEWKAMSTTVKEIQDGKVMDEYYDGFDQILTRVEEEINLLVDKQREDMGDFRNYSTASIFISLLIFKDIATRIKFNTWVETRKNWTRHFLFKGSVLVAFAVGLYHSGKELGDIAERAHDIVVQKEFIEMLEGLEIKQEDITILEGIIQEDEQKLNQRIHQFTAQGKIKSAGQDHEGQFFCHPNI